MKKTFKVAVFGLGTVGSSFIQLLEREKNTLHAKTGKEISITAIHANDKNKERAFHKDSYQWIDDVENFIENTDVDCMIELIGGVEGVAPKIWQKTIEKNIPLVTANKALLAEKGKQFLADAHKNNTPIAYEASVAGGVPIIRHITQSIAGNAVYKIQGIVNGTCNFILSEMEEKERDFDSVLKEAQELGYAEMVPDFDIGGIDAAHKITILSSLAYRCPMNFEHVRIRGIKEVCLQDIIYAKKIGYTIKLIAYSEIFDDQSYIMHVEPVLVHLDNVLAHIRGVTNAVETHDHDNQKILLTGLGAGGMPTASAVLSDVISIARDQPSTYHNNSHISFERRSLTHIQGRYFLLLSVHDQTGVLAGIATILAQYSISIEHLIQHERMHNGKAHIAITTHSCSEENFLNAFSMIEKSEHSTGKQRYYKIID